VTSGFQWLDGSFLEDIEKTERRDPGDIDIVSFVRFPAWATADQGSWDRFAQSNAGLFDRVAKVTFGCDSYFVDLDLDAEDIVASTRYWFGLFSPRNGLRSGRACWRSLSRTRKMTSTHGCSYNPR
jgi:hypothetical protein